MKEKILENNLLALLIVIPVVSILILIFPIIAIVFIVLLFISFPFLVVYTIVEGCRLLICKIYNLINVRNNEINKIKDDTKMLKELIRNSSKRKNWKEFIICAKKIIEQKNKDNKASFDIEKEVVIKALWNQRNDIENGIIKCLEEEYKIEKIDIEIIKSNLNIFLFECNSEEQIDKIFKLYKEIYDYKVKISNIKKQIKTELKKEDNIRC